jgi:hypothetical protein
MEKTKTRMLVEAGAMIALAQVLELCEAIYQVASGWFGDRRDPWCPYCFLQCKVG